MNYFNIKSILIFIVLCGCNLLLAQSSSSTIAYHKVKIGENLTIEIRGVPREEQARVAASYSVTKKGEVTLPFLAEPIKAQGFTMDEIAIKIKNAYIVQEIYTSPVILVSSAGSDAEDRSRSEQIITVGGEVRSPSQIPYRQDMTIYQAVQAVGGLTPFGSLKRVKLIRRGVGDKVYDLSTSEGKAILIKPSDTIEVDKRGLLKG